ncbi:MAG: hypothetical protein PHS33_07855 [Candidatus Omnitrophica bacterium]|nr:hypothetical protein [Candidatus Omnitrophota bacterium]
MEWIKSSLQLPKAGQCVWVYNGSYCHATVFDPENPFFDLWVSLPNPPTTDNLEPAQQTDNTGSPKLVALADRAISQLKTMSLHQALDTITELRNQLQAGA